jgi:hypothetical protein
MSDVLASIAPFSVSAEEELIDVPEAEKESDVLRRASIRRILDGVAFYGVVQDIEQGKESGERLYLVRYTDGDFEHLTAAEVRDSFCECEEVLLDTQPRPCVASPARDGMLIPREEEVPISNAIANEEEQDEQLVKEDIVTKLVSVVKATPRGTENARDVVVSKMFKKPISVSKEISKKPASVLKATPMATDKARAPKVLKILKKPART